MEFHCAYHRSYARGKDKGCKKTKFHNAAGVIIYYAKCGWDEKLRIPQEDSLKNFTTVDERKSK